MSTLKNLIFPKNIYCINCNLPIKKTNPYSLCKSCFNNLYFINFNKYLKENKINLSIKKDEVVIDLINSKILKSEDHIRFLSLYCNTMKTLIENFKFNNKTYIAPYLSNMVIDFLKNDPLSFQYISYVPISKRRKKIRGYNQCQILSNYIGKNLNIPVLNIGKRIKHTRHLYNLKKKFREEEMKNAFTCPKFKFLEGKSILIIDDILTTGATAKSLIKEFNKNNKNTTVKLLFLGRTPNF